MGAPLDGVTDLARHIAETRAARAAGGAVWYFHHIQKTAGTSLIEDVRLHGGVRVANIFLSDDEYRNYTPDSLSRAIERKAEVIRAGRCDMVTGEFSRAEVDTLMQLRPIRLFTFMREPVARIISAYRYQLSPDHPPHEAFRARFPNLMDFARQPYMRNAAARSFCRDRRGLSDLEPSLNLFDFIGTTEQYRLSFRLATAFLREAREPVLHERRTMDAAATAVEATPEMRTEILALNAVDAELHRRASEVLQRLAPQIEALKGPRRSGPPAHAINR